MTGHNPWSWFSSHGAVCLSVPSLFYYYTLHLKYHEISFVVNWRFINKIWFENKYLKPTGTGMGVDMSTKIQFFICNHVDYVAEEEKKHNNNQPITLTSLIKKQTNPDLPARIVCVCICSLILTRSTGAPRPTDISPVSMLATVRSSMPQGCRPSP